MGVAKFRVTLKFTQPSHAKGKSKLAQSLVFEHSSLLFLSGFLLPIV